MKDIIHLNPGKDPRLPPNMFGNWIIDDFIPENEIIAVCVEDAEGYPIIESIQDIDNHFGTKITNKIIVRAVKYGEPSPTS